MGVAKVILNNETLIDVTQKTVTSSNLLSGITALGRDGENIVGIYTPVSPPVYQSKTITPTNEAQIIVPDSNNIVANRSSSLRFTDTLSAGTYSTAHGMDLSMLEARQYTIALSLQYGENGVYTTLEKTVSETFQNGEFNIQGSYLNWTNLKITSTQVSITLIGDHEVGQGFIINSIVIIDPSVPPTGYDALSSVIINPIPSPSVTQYIRVQAKLSSTAYQAYGKFIGYMAANPPTSITNPYYANVFSALVTSSYRPLWIPCSSSGNGLLVVWCDNSSYIPQYTVNSGNVINRAYTNSFLLLEVSENAQISLSVYNNN